MTGPVFNIFGYCHMLHFSAPRLELLRDMLLRHLEPDAICYSAVASACEPPALIQQCCSLSFLPLKFD